MILKKIKLENIRSYQQETVNFPSGSVVLAGDIGSGKSSLLLAIEFALFGSSRPDLPAESLLRKGSNLGSVELTLQLNGQEMIIKRVLKKDKNAIRQMPGYLIVNGLKKELTPVELKAEIIRLLGYPEEFASKNKNYIFRYTVYTPQEDMKSILFENSELRLDSLRKIFNIDKYINIRNNLQNYLRDLRKQIAILKTKTEDLPEKKQELNSFLEEKNKVEEELASLEKELQQKKEKLEKQRTCLTELKEQKRKFDEYKNKKEKVELLLKEKKEQLLLGQEKEKELSEIFINSSHNLGNKEEIETKLKNLEEEKQLFLNKRNLLKERITRTQQFLLEIKNELSSLEKEVSILEQKETKKQELEAINNKEDIKINIVNLEHSLKQIYEKISEKETVLKQSLKLKNKIVDLDNCPTCLQEVSDDHRGRIVNQESQKINVLEEEVFQATTEKKIIVERLELAKKDLEEKNRKERELAVLNVEISKLKEQKQNIVQKREQFSSLVKENNSLIEEFADLNKKYQEEKLLEEIDSLKEKLRKCIEVENLNVRLKEKREELERIKQQLSDLLGEQELILKHEISNPHQLIVEQEEKVNKSKEEEKNLSDIQARRQNSKEHLRLQIEKSEEKIKLLLEHKNKLVKLKENYYWLDKYFLKLTYTIEKQVMLKIHQLFDQLFQEWFSILMEDENISARIDDSFTPIIEQNGYDVAFNYLSGGEKTSAALAYRLALNKVINDVIHQINTKNLIILDEPTDGFSSEQLDKVRDVLERLKLQQILIVSHESKIESFVENVIRIEKRGHVSTIG